ncbi:hypothetical protein AV530_016523 [Patagioenas fasciata monilis]|uniref:Uncharacterized protein n=1 Tax=Patagioenas fasciata monilis TaxID=372326 RepID=A0A1V4J345_PATFA|nr:hypothetical protein AV530_016523 [Patagioenas fasciata monilis]
MGLMCACPRSARGATYCGRLVPLQAFILWWRPWEVSLKEKERREVSNTRRILLMGGDKRRITRRRVHPKDAIGSCKRASSGM